MEKAPGPWLGLAYDFRSGVVIGGCDDFHEPAFICDLGAWSDGWNKPDLIRGLLSGHGWCDQTTNQVDTHVLNSKHGSQWNAALSSQLRHVLRVSATGCRDACSIVVGTLHKFYEKMDSIR